MALETQLLAIARGASLSLPKLSPSQACAAIHRAARATSQALGRQPCSSIGMRELERQYGLLTLVQPGMPRAVLERAIMTLSSACTALPPTPEIMRWQALATAAQQALYASRGRGSIDAWTVAGTVAQQLPAVLRSTSNQWIQV